MDRQYSEFNGRMFLAAFLAPVLGGAVLYYGLRATLPHVANRANGYSWIAFFVWLAIILTVSSSVVIPALFKLIGLAFTIIGVAMASEIASKIKRQYATDFMAESQTP